MGKEDMFSDSLRLKFASLIDKDEEKPSESCEIKQKADDSETVGGCPSDVGQTEILPVVRDLSSQVTVARQMSESGSPGSQRASGKLSSRPGTVRNAGERQERLRLQYRAEHTITYSIRWDLGKSQSGPDFGDACAVLEIACSAQKTPELRLVCREDGYVPLSDSDPGLIVLHTIRPFEKGFPQGRYTLPLTGDMLQGIDPDTPLRLFLQEKDLGSYYMRPKREETSSAPSFSFISSFRSLLPEQIICPNCLETLRRRNVIRACSVCNTPAPNARGVVKCTREGCSGYTTKLICELCGETLPDGFLEYEKYLRFSLIGTVGAGKTSFLTAMLHELKNTRNIPWVLSHMDAVTEASFREKDNLMFHEKKTLESTPTGRVQPMLWQIRNRDQATDRKVPTYSMTIFDGAGEDCETINQKTKPDPLVCRYINGSKALVILIDPLALQGAAKLVSPDLREWSATSDHDDNSQASTDLVNNMADYIRTCCGIKRGERIDRDVAVVFTKIDLFADEFESGVVMQPGPHLLKRGFDVCDADAVDEEVRSWLYEIGEHAFLNAVELNFKKDRLRFFGVSSFGKPPVGQYSLDEEVIPHRVLDPLVWMLYKEGIAPEV